ncbi:hypothetical protein [Vaccinium witches'-broom phytoplasma]|uniref:hypothetical protein n=1 Tax=Vaccinium witches'-broom phytoplasma TaxID=85642 RepID=UPI0004BBD5FC|nr:hypothetical protein [Vaccinium witches'-broom phytoplasma]
MPTNITPLFKRGWSCLLFAGGFLIAALLFQWGSSLPKTHLHFPLKESIKE